MGFFDSSQTASETKNFNQVSNPWSVQSPFLQQGFNTASGALNQAQGVQGPTDFVAQMTPEQRALYDRMYGYGMNTAVPSGAAGASNVLTGMGADAFSKAVTGLSGYAATPFDQILQNASSAAAANPATQGMIDAAMRDANRSVSEVALPQNALIARSSGNLNSSTTANREQQILRDLADRQSDVSANIRNNVFNTGFGGAIQSALAGDNSKLGALQTLMGGGTSGVGTGVGAGAGAIAQQGGLFDLANQGAGGVQAGNQADLANQLARYQFGTSSPFAGLSDYWNIVGSNNWGGTTSGTSTTSGTKTNSPSDMAKVGSVIGTLGSLFG
jgi:hypothetical protein